MFEKALSACVLGLGVAALLSMLIGFPVMFLWNAVVPQVFGLPAITFWQAVFMYLLVASFRGGRQ